MADCCSTGEGGDMRDKDTLEAVSLSAKYTDIRIEATRCEYEAKIDAVEKQLEVALAGIASKFESTNELREAMRDQASRTISRTEVMDLLRPMESDIRELRESKAQLAGVASQDSVNDAQRDATFGKWVSFIATLLSIAGLLVALFLKGD